MDETVRAEMNRIHNEDCRQNKRIDLLEESVKAIRDLVISVHTLAHGVKEMLEEQKGMGNRLDKLEKELGNRWRRMWDKVIDTAVGIIAGGAVAGLVILASQYIK